MSSENQIKAAQRADWDAVAVGWERWDAFQEEQTRPVNEWLCHKAALSSGKTVLDLASGSGQPAFTAARFVQPDGRVVATDIAPEMVEVLKRRAAAEGLENLEARVMDMEELEFPEGSFDALTCRWGYMFCPDVPQAIRESKRVLKPGGRLTVAVWSPPVENPWLASFTTAINQIAPPPAPPDPDALGPFRLSDRSRLEGLIREAGWSDYSLEPVRFSFDFDSPEQWWAFVFDIAAPVRGRLLALSQADQKAVKQLVLAEAGRFTAEGKVRVPATNLCAVATR